MADIRRILCPVDFSEHSRHAFEHAVALARSNGAALTVLHVAPLLPPATMSDAARAALLQDLQRFTATATAANRPADLVLVEGSAVTEILNQASALSADLIVIGTHGRSGFDHLVLGSVTEKVLRKASCPVLSVPRHESRPISAPVSFTQILCPVDFSDAALRAVRYAIALGRQAHARVLLLHVSERVSQRFPELYETAAAEIDRLPGDTKAQDDDTRARLEALIPPSACSFCTVEVTSGKASREILRVAHEQQSDLIVIGVQGRGAADLMFFGSTTQHVVRAATCPVLTLRRE